jgi:SAM-dependent methyltransferase
MPTKDALRWNARYLDENSGSFISPRALLVENASFLPRSGLALDAAMGLGGNSGLLIEQGLNVIGVDISELAVSRAKHRFPQLWAVIADLTQFYIPQNAFDVILNFFYLERGLWPCYIQALKPGGVLFFESLTLDMLQIHPKLNPTHLLKKDELKLGFYELEILVYREGWIKPVTGHPRAVASLIGRKLH